ncbi:MULTISPECIES: thioredoxin domain-containing protein [unclassified Legionella]|uniref:thioredoxin domain-containing protein n=1 Tax=unclassified Legionella TaxID=2622702 RepID=UPI001055A9A1|nr:MULTISPECIES: thioredoxin domain-containing protein [unclassified Legionella]MDI9819833.1 thioredoxin domain-containing protein [Legionella sp. PL877]
MAEPQITNHLIHEKSPYLQQHAHNPVQWHPWGKMALEKSKKDNKPILLSIGYAACHWCHVMAHESFEDEETAILMNKLFINIKVDKEERPDLDKIYQTAHHLLNRQSGGWPLTIFLTPDLTPFFSGTYFPPEDRYQLPGFKKILKLIAEFYHHHPREIKQQSIEIKRILQQQNQLTTAITGQSIENALIALERQHDKKYGGFQGAPKFPQASKLEFLLKNATSLALSTLKHMAKGGIYDQLMGGFYRYSVDEKWNIPHFEKMLYDNGQLLTLYALAYQQSPEPLFKKITTETANWVTEQMQSSEGGYYSSLDADSEGEEGKFYRWLKSEVRSLLTPEEYAVIHSYFGLDEPPNFEHHWHLYVAESLQLISQKLNISLDKTQQLVLSSKKKLLAARNQRLQPYRDEKILTSWNALMIKGMLLAGNSLNEKRFLSSGQQAILFIKQKLWNGQHLFASYKDGQAYLLAYLDDYAFLLDAIITSLEITWDSELLAFAVKLADTVLNEFPDNRSGGFFFTAKDHEKLLYRPKLMIDEAIPAGNGVIVRVFLTLSYLLGDTRYLEAAEKTLQVASSHLIHYPEEHCSLLSGLNYYLRPPPFIIIRGNREKIKTWQENIKTINNHTFTIPNDITDLPDLLARKTDKGDCYAYLCQGLQCSEIIKDIDKLKSVK